MNQAADKLHEYFSRVAHDHPRVMILILVGLVAALSVLVFSHQSLRLDEAQSLWQTSHTPSKMLSVIAQDVHVPLYHMILHFWQVAFGNGVASARTLSLLFFMLAVPAIYLVGKTTYNNSVGVFAATLLSISPFMNWYGNEIRMYSLFALITILNQYFFISIFKRESAAGEQRAWAGYAITAILGLYTHYFFGFALLSQALFFVLYRHQFAPYALRRFILCGILVIAAFAPWLGYVWNQGGASNSRPLIAEPTSINVFNAFSQFLFGFQNDHINTILVSLWPLSVLLVFLSLRAGKKTSPESIYLLMALLVPITAVFVISTAIRPIFLTRYLILTLPSLYLVISWLFWTYPPRLSFLAKGILVTAITATLVVEIGSANTPVKENYREASAYLSDRARAQDIIVVSAPFTIYPVEYYYRGPAAIQTLPLWDRYAYGPIPPYVESQMPAQVDTIAGTHDTLWLLLSYDQGYEQKLRYYFDTHYERIESRTFSPGLTVHGYKLRYDTKPRPMLSASSSREQ